MRFVTLALCFFFLSGCASPQGITLWNPLTWTAGRAAAKVERVENRKGMIEREMLHAATLEAFKTTVALGDVNFEESQRVEVGQGLAGNTFNLLNSLSPLTFGEVSHAQDLVTGLLSGRADAVREQERLGSQFAAQGEKLAEVRAELSKLGKEAKAEAEANLALANQLRNERLIKWAAFAGNGVLLIAVFAYRTNLLGVTTGLAKGLAGMQRKFGAGDEDLNSLKAEIDALTSVGQQAKIAARVAKYL